MSLQPPFQPGDDPFGEIFAHMDFTPNTPQQIKVRVERAEQVIVLQKQDIAIRIPFSDCEMAVEVLKWCSIAGIQRAEADQSIDLIRDNIKECEGR